mgnify:CR=1 FL=1
MSEAVCAVTTAYEQYMEFTAEKLCGRCIPCPAAAPLIIDTLQRLRQGGATVADISELENMCQKVFVTALCKNGQKAVANLLEAVKKHRENFDTHAVEKRCPERSCRELLRYRVNPDRCTLCGKCKEVCPVGAIVGEPYVAYRTDNQPYEIIEGKCTRCGLCLEVCTDEAIEVV